MVQAPSSGLKNVLNLKLFQPKSLDSAVLSSCSQYSNLLSAEPTPGILVQHYLHCVSTNSLKFLKQAFASLIGRYQGLN